MLREASQFEAGTMAILKHLTKKQVVQLIQEFGQVTEEVRRLQTRVDFLEARAELDPGATHGQVKAHAKKKKEGKEECH